LRSADRLRTKGSWVQILPGAPIAEGPLTAGLLVSAETAMEWLADPQAWIALATLTALEIVLGVDNIIFISILVGRLPVESRQRARVIGLALAMLTRILLLLTLAWIMGLTQPLFEVLGADISGRDIILVSGGLFLLWKSVHEIHNALEGEAGHEGGAARAGFAAVIAQIAVIDIVFSLDSVITAIGMVDQVWVMVVAMVIAMLVMLYFAGPIGRFVEKHPTIKILALSFLILIGVMLVAEGLGQHIDKGYIYAAMAFAVVVEMINMQIRRPKRKKEPPVLPVAAE
jgi:predicted tellurium resistance membrane protein TerC